MATTADIEKLIDELRGQIKTHKQMLEPNSDPAKTVSNVETQLSDLEKRYAVIKQNNGDLAPVEKELQNLDKLLELTAKGLTPSQDAKRSRMVAFLGQYASLIGIVVLALISLLVAGTLLYTLREVGAAAWQTIAGGRAVLLVALTFAFVIFGGALLISPLFAEGDLNERFRRSREIFLLFAGMFTTIVGFYFASANNAGSRILIAETFDAAKGEMQVTVTGGTSPYIVEVEYGGKEAVNKKTPETLDGPGSVKFAFSKSDWPKPMTIKVKDGADVKAERSVVLDKEELIAAGFKEPKKGQQAEQKPGDVPVAAKLTLDSKFDAATSTVEVIVKGGKPPYKVEATYGKDKAKKPTQEIASAGGSTKISFEKTKDWPLPLSISVQDSEGKSEERSVQVDENVLTQAGFKNPQGQ